MSSLLEIVNGKFGYNKNILVEGGFSLSSGEFVILEGKNGSGKSTVIKSVLGYIKPLGGKVRWGVGFEKVGYVPQELHLDRRIPASSLDIVLTSFNKRGRNEKEASFKALRKLGVENLSHLRYGDLSGGQKRRVLMARALALSPSVLILDEPTVNIDAETENELAAILHDMAFNNDLGILVTTHVASWIKEARKIKIDMGILHD